MPLHHYCCSDCGAWQEYFATPPFCFVCCDVRNALPADGWRFVSARQMREREERGEATTHWEWVNEDIVKFMNQPLIGIGSCGYLIVRPQGNVAFEAAAWYSQEALDFIASLGGIATLSCSHPHGMGALWQLQERFSPEVAIQRDGVQYTKAFRVTVAYDLTLELDDELSLHLVGGHYEGHAVLHDRKRKALFCGDALKFETNAEGATTHLSCHKAFHKRIPLSHDEIRTYRRVIGALHFTQAFTPFEHAPRITTADAVALFDYQLASRRTSTQPIRLNSLNESSSSKPTADAASE